MTSVWGPQTDFGLSNDELMEEVSLHLARKLGEAQIAFADLEGWAGRSREDGPPIDVLVVPPEGERRFAYVSSFGCAFRPLPAPRYAESGARRRVEFVLAAPQSGEPLADRQMLNIAANTVRQFAKLVHLNPISVEFGDTVAFSGEPEPLFEGSAQCAFAFAAPRLPAPGFESMRLSQGETIRFIAPVPIFREELEAGRVLGPAALADALRDGGVTEMIDLGRESVAEVRPEPKRGWWTRLLSLIGIR